MADTTALKNRIRTAVKSNDNQEITGPVLQQALLDIVDELNGATETEASQRQNADVTLQQNIAAEKNRAEGVESALQQNIATEATARQEEDIRLNNLINSLDNEEQQRIEAEMQRQQAELQRENNENLRIDHEDIRQSNESERNSAEDSRQYNEGIRSEAETYRNDAESERIENENNRKAAEVVRQRNENDRSTAETNRSRAESQRSINEQNRMAAEEARQQALLSYINDGTYNRQTKKIELLHDNTTIAQIDTSDFLIDSMVDDVRIENGYLIIDFNTASGKQDISIPLTDIFNPANYYTKSEADDRVVNILNSAEFSDNNAGSAVQGTEAVYTYRLYWKGEYEDFGTLRLLSATQEIAGLMSAADKAKLDNILPQIERKVEEHEDRITELEDTAVRTSSYDATVGVGLADNLRGDTIVEAEFYKRKTGGTQNVGSGIAAIKEVRGKSIVWNQLVKASTSSDNLSQFIDKGLTPTKLTDGVISFSGVATKKDYVGTKYNKFATLVIGHKYYIKACINESVPFQVAGFSNIWSRNGKAVIKEAINNVKSGPILSVIQGTSYNDVFAPIFIDLTLAYGNGNEPATVEEFEKMFSLDYYDYNAGEVIPFAGQNLVTIGKNQYNPVTGKANLLGGQTYQLLGTYTSATIDEVAVTLDSNNCFTTTKDCVLDVTGGNDTDTFVGFYDGENGAYESYEKHTLPLDPSQWRDKQGNLVFPYGGMHGVGTAYDYTKIDADGYIRKANLVYGGIDLGNYDYTKQGNLYTTKGFVPTKANMLFGRGKSIVWNQLLQEGKLVDMGLPSGTLWASCNIDVTQPDGFAASPFQYECSFFSWGNVDGHNPISNSKIDYNFGNRNSQEPWYDGQVYGDTQGNTLTGNIPVGDTYDAARVNVGSLWCMPTKENYEELFANIRYINADGTEVDTTKTDKRVNVNGILGLYIESTINGARLFFPCSGQGYGSSWKQRGEIGHYWSSTWNAALSAIELTFNSSRVFPQVAGTRSSGNALRPVITKSALICDGKSSHKYAISSNNKNIFDATLMFGTGNEPVTVEEFEKMFPLDYYAYDAGSLGILTKKTYADAASFKAAMQGVPLIYELAEPIEVELATPVYAKYLVNKDGTEEIVPANGAKPYTTPANLSILYAMDARGEIKNLPKNYLSKESVESMLNAMLGSGIFEIYTMTWNEAKNRYDFTFNEVPEEPVPEEPEETIND